MLRHALRHDLPAVVETWVEAFSADPFFRWIAPEDDTYGGFATDWLGLIAGLCFERGHTYLCDEAAVAWVPPDLSLIGPDDVATAQGILATYAGEERAGEALAVIMAARGHVLEEPHWSLQYIGVRGAAQSAGLGVAVAKIGLATVDRDGVPCALTSTNAKNVPFYQRLGFSVTAEIPTPDGAAALRPMVRIPHERRHVGRHERGALFTTA
ncbi:GNAT family N-acetyltransferase [Nocardioides stalactiti]|uniref:GNAT family N-acetyltransferase n=1 Tax=Nocardioides stalactiti TaxID=2755356 RepID=UPI001602ADA5|nr:GNAT family N-acetyltransferase [Nocardioides stalactiti]